jgi:hypothetical protein
MPMLWGWPRKARPSIRNRFPQVVNYYDVLGVSPNATEREVADAHRHLARQFHPDQHPSASPAERRQFEQAMARINEAYNAIKDPANRRAYDDSLSGRNRQDPITDNLRAPKPWECMLCGSAPAAPVLFQHVHAFLIFASAHEVGGPFCRNCAQAIGRAKQNRTLWAGWWGVLSFLRNLGCVYQNARQLAAVQRMDTPRRSADVVAPIPFPLPPGRPVFARFGFWLPVVAIVLLIGAVAAEESTQTRTPNRPPAGVSTATTRPASVSATTWPRSSPTTTRAATWAVGSCVRESGGQWLQPVHCSQSNSGRIVSRVRYALDCPFDAEWYVEDGPWVYCIMRR